jgi:hypothetical protein
MLWRKVNLILWLNLYLIIRILILNVKLRLRNLIRLLLLLIITLIDLLLWIRINLLLLGINTIYLILELVVIKNPISLAIIVIIIVRNGILRYLLLYSLKYWLTYSIVLKRLHILRNILVHVLIISNVRKLLCLSWNIFPNILHLLIIEIVLLKCKIKCALLLWIILVWATVKRWLIKIRHFIL